MQAIGIKIGVQKMILHRLVADNLHNTIIPSIVNTYLNLNLIIDGIFLIVVDGRRKARGSQEIWNDSGRLSSLS